ncbi:MAG: tetratricopeptide repeat protein, partial [Betaproteobacteria bacterium]|nr:tetratricopeptide repeat protein [Betaproteobacteria bacterium]
MKPGRDDPCSCGSGRKFKNCCQDKYEARVATPNICAGGSVLTSTEIEQLVALFSAGRYAELEGRTHELLERCPDSGLIWKALGVSLQMQGKDAVPALQKATELLPDDAEAHYNLGNVLKDLGQLDEAMASYRRAIGIKPDFAEAHSNLGVIQQGLGLNDEAMASCCRALELKPGFAEAHSNLGNALKGLGQINEAVASYRLALKLKPDFAEAHYNLGNSLIEIGHLNEAAASYRRAIEIRPGYAAAHSNLLFLFGYHGLLDPHGYLSHARGWEQACVPAQERAALHSRPFQR